MDISDFTAEERDEVIEKLNEICEVKDDHWLIKSESGLWDNLKDRCRALRVHGITKPITHWQYLLNKSFGGEGADNKEPPPLRLVRYCKEPRCIAHTSPSHTKESIVYEDLDHESSETIKRYLEDNSIVDEKTGCRLWQLTTQYGYGCGSVFGKAYKMHRVAYQFYHHKTLPEDVMVLHDRKCLNKHCLAENHLREGDASDNMEDVIASGTMKKGEAYPSARYSDAKIEEVKDLLETQYKNVSVHKVAVELGMNSATLHSLRKYGTRTPPKDKQQRQEKLSDEEVRQIRKMAERTPKPSIASIARLYKQNWTRISDVVKRRTYKNVMDDEKAQAEFDERERKEDIEEVKRRLQLMTEKPANSECWNWKGWKSESGYGQASWHGKHYGSHILSWMVHRNDGKPPADNMEVRHLCPDKPNPSCLNPQHLEIGTKKQNMQDKITHGTMPMGERHSGAIVDNKTREAIVESCATKRVKEVFEEFQASHGLKYQQIAAIKFQAKEAKKRLEKQRATTL